MTLKPYELHSAAILTSVDKLSSMKQMYIDILNGKIVLEMPGVIIIEMANHFIVELYTEIADIPGYLFQHQTMVLGYRTEDIEFVYKQLQQENYDLKSPIQQAGECYSYFHYAGPDGQIYMISELNKHKHS